MLIICFSLVPSPHPQHPEGGGPAIPPAWPGSHRAADRAHASRQRRPWRVSTPLLQVRGLFDWSGDSLGCIAESPLLARDTADSGMSALPPTCTYRIAQDSLCYCRFTIGARKRPSRATVPLEWLLPLRRGSLRRGPDERQVERRKRKLRRNGTSGERRGVCLLRTARVLRTVCGNACLNAQRAGRSLYPFERCACFGVCR